MSFDFYRNEIEKLAASSRQESKDRQQAYSDWIRRAVIAGAVVGAGAGGFRYLPRARKVVADRKVTNAQKILDKLTNATRELELAL